MSDEPLKDPETCSWCLEEVEDSELVQQPDGARVCRRCRVAPVPRRQEVVHYTGDEPWWDHGNG